MVVEIIERLEEGGLRNLMQVSKHFQKLAEQVTVFGHLPLSIWSIGVLNRFLQSYPLISMREARHIRMLTCHRAGEPSYVPLEFSPSTVQETETRAFYNLMAKVRLPTPEIFLGALFYGNFYSAQAFWSTQPPVFWLPQDFPADLFEHQMAKYPGDSFMAAVLARMSQLIFRDFLTPYLMSRYILPCLLGGRTYKWSPEIKLFLGRLSRATYCFNIYLSFIYRLVDYMDNSLIAKSNLIILCRRLDCKLKGVPLDSVYERIQEPKYHEMWKQNPEFIIHLASLFGMDPGNLAEQLIATSRPRTGTYTPNQSLQNFATRRWSVPVIPPTPMGLILIAARKHPVPVEVQRGEILPVDINSFDYMEQ